ncbi:MAG: VanZ family protein [Litorilituus sp.]|jgi:VanZ family protein|nr:VanZ family protein [Litorilituus sp.]
MKQTIPALFGFIFIAWLITQANKGSNNVLFTMVGFIPFGDKLGHLLLFGILSLLTIIAFKCRSVKISNYQVPIGALLVLFFAMLEELSQLLFINRTVDLLDALANIIGISISIFISSKYKTTLMKTY